MQTPVPSGPTEEPSPDSSVCSRESGAAWAWLIDKVYEADPLVIKTGKAHPGVDPAALN